MTEPKQKGRLRGLFHFVSSSSRSALACFKARVALADDEHFAAAAHDLAVAVALLGGFERGKNFHGGDSDWE